MNRLPFQRTKPGDKAEADVPAAEIPKRLADPHLNLTSMLVWVCTAFLVLSLGYSTYFHIAVDVLPFDDAFITYRYVDKVLDGKGLVYNEGERVFGTTTPLYLLWLCVLKLALGSVPVPALAVRCNVLFHVVSALAVLALIRTMSGRVVLALLGASLFCLDMSMLQISTGGMESFLFVALALWSAWALTAHRFGLAAALASLSMLARPEGIFSVAVCVLAWTLRGRSRFVKFGVFLLFPVLAWVGFATLYFGTPIPHSIIAKNRPLYPLPPGSALSTILYSIGCWPCADRTGCFGYLCLILSLGLVPLAGYACVRYTAARRRSAWIPVALLSFYLLFYLFANPLVFPWYMPHIYATWFLTLILGLPWFGAQTEALIRRNAHLRVGRAKAENLLLVLVLLVLTVSILKPYRLYWSSGERIADSIKTPARQRTIGYKKAAEWLNGVALASATVAASEIGAFGYYWQGRILDACGLISPSAIPFLPVPKEQRSDVTVGAISTGFVEATTPDYVATMSCFADRSLLQSGWFLSHYKLINEVPLPAECWGSEHVLLFQREDPRLEE